MSKRRFVNTDAERTPIMMELLHREQPQGGMSMRNIVLEEVAPETGFGRRWADALVLAMWKSDGLELDGFEVKASRADLRRELADASKWRAVGRYCDSWTLLAWDEKVIAGMVDDLPPEWGIVVTQECDAHGDRELATVRRAKKLTPEPWPRSFVCSMVRNAYEQAPGAAYLARAIGAATKTATKEGRYIEHAAWENRLSPLKHAMYGTAFNWPKVALDDDAFIKAVIERVTQLPLAAGASK